MTLLAQVPADRLQGIRGLVLDVDGVLTDGGIVYTGAGEEVKRFHVRDGSGIKYWLRVGRQIALLSGRSSPILQRRADELSIAVVHMGAKNKLPVFQQILEELQLTAAECAYVGDDLPDLPPLRAAGLGIAVADAVQELRDTADAVTEQCGGHGAVREVVEALLRAQGLWDRILERYRPTPEERGLA